MSSAVKQIWADDQAEDIAEYAMMLAIIAVLVLATLQAIGSGANSVFSQIASTLKAAA